MTSVNSYFIPVFDDTPVIEMHPCHVSGDLYEVSELVRDINSVPERYIHPSQIDAYVNSQGWNSEEIENVKRELKKQDYAKRNKV